MMTLARNPADTLASIAETKSTYAQIFDSSNPNWERKPEYVMLFLKNVQNYMNDLLNARGYVFLNDVYDRLGFQRTPAGQLVGWIKDGGVGYVNFGLPSAPADNQLLPVESIAMDFNVDGIIYNLI